MSLSGWLDFFSTAAGFTILTVVVILSVAVLVWLSLH